MGKVSFGDAYNDWKDEKQDEESSAGTSGDNYSGATEKEVSTSETSTSNKKKNDGGLGGGLGYVGQKFLNGAVSNIEGIVDFAVGGVAQLIGQKEFAKKVFEDDWYNYEAADEKYNPGTGWKVAGDITGVVGGAVPDIIIGVATGGYGWLGKAISIATSTASASGRGVSEAVKTTDKLGGKEWAGGIGSGVLAGGLELVLGGLGDLTGNFFGKTGVEFGSEIGESLSKKYSKETISGVLGKNIGKEVGSEIGEEVGEEIGESASKKLFHGILSSKTAKEILGEMGSEALEEGLEAWIEPEIVQGTYNPNAPDATVGDIAYSALLGGVGGGLTTSGVKGVNFGIQTVRGAKISSSTNTMNNLLQNAEAISNYESEKQTGSEVFEAVSRLYGVLKDKLSGGGAISVSTMEQIGELESLVNTAVLQPSMVNAAKGIAKNAESVAESLNNFYKKTGQNVSITAEQLTAGLKMDGSSREFVNSVMSALGKNGTLRQVVINNMLGRMEFDARYYASSIFGDIDISSIATMQNLNRFLANADAATLGQVGAALGIENWGAVTPEEFAQKIAEFKNSGRASAYENGIEAIKKAHAIKDYTNGMPSSISSLRSGATRFKSNGLDFAIIREGNAYRLYDYQTGQITKPMGLYDMEALVQRIRGRASQIGAESEMAALDRELDAFALENVPEYKNLTESEREAVRATLRYARANGISAKDQILFARIAAKSGMNIIVLPSMDEDAFFDGVNSIYINAAAPRTRTFSALLGHEMWHKMFKAPSAKNLFMQAWNNIDPQKRQSVIDRYMAELEKRGKSLPDRINESNEEVAAAYAEELFNFPDVWDFVLDGEPTLKDRVIAFFKGSPKRYSFAPEMDPAARAWLREYKKLFDQVAQLNAGNNVATNVGEDKRVIRRLGKMVEGNSKFEMRNSELDNSPKTIKKLGKIVENAQKTPLTNINQEDMNVSGRSAITEEIKITPDMSEEERYEALKGRVIKNIPSVTDLSPKVLDKVPEISSWKDIDYYFGKNKKKIIKKIANEFGVVGSEYYNEDLDLSFVFSGQNFAESYDKQKHNFSSFAKMFSVFDPVIDSAIGVEIHNRSEYKPDPTLDNVFVLMSAYQDGDYLVPVKLEIKQFKDKKNTLYVAISLNKIKMTELNARGDTYEGVTQRTRSVNISISKIFEKINPSDKSFVKYIPDGFLSKELKKAKKEAIIEDIDNAYESAVNRKDVETAKILLEKKAKTVGYDADFNWRMNHQAPNSHDDTGHSLDQIDRCYGGDGSIYSKHAVYYYGEGRNYDSKTIRVIQSARNNPDAMVKIYRAVPTNVQDTRVRNGDWVAVVKEYAEEHGDRLLDGDYRIIENIVPAKHLWNNGDSINEFGYDNGNTNEVYKNTANNVKTTDITYDDEGKLIPISKRYDDGNSDIRYALKTDPDYKAKVDAKAKEKIAKATAKAEARAEAKIEKANAKAEKKLEVERTKLKAEYETDRVFTQSSVTKGLGEIDAFKDLPAKERSDISHRVWRDFNESDGYNSREWIALKWTTELTDRLVREKGDAVSRRDREIIFNQVNSSMEKLAASGKTSIRGKMEGELREEIKATESVRRNVLSDIYQSLKKINDVKTARFTAASDYKGREFKGSIERLTRMDWRGRLNDNIVRREMKILSEWYNPVNNPMLKSADDQEINTTLYEAGIKNRLDALAEGEGELSNSELGMLSDTLKYFTKLVDEYDSVFIGRKWQSGEDIVYKLRDNIKKQEKIKIPMLIRALRHRVASGDLRAFADPLTVMKLSDMYEDGIFTKIYKDWMWGEINSDAEVLSIKEEYDTFIKKNANYLAKSEDTRVILHGARVNRLQLISYVMTLKRKGSWLGVAHDGVVFRDKDGRDVTMRPIVPIKDGPGFNKRLEEAIESERRYAERFLNARDRKFMQILERGFERAKATKAAADMQRLGFVNVVDGYYYPIRRAYTEHMSEFEAELITTDRYANASFNKRSIENAKSALIIGSADATFNSHIRGVSRYMYLSPVMDSFNKLYKLKVLETKPGTGADIGALYALPGSTFSLQSLINQAKSTWRQDGKVVGFDYLQNLMLDTMGKGKRSIGDDVTGWFRSGYVGFALGANPKVLATQFSSLFASTSVLDVSSHLLAGFASNKRVDDYSVVAKLRNSDYDILKSNAVTDRVGKFSRWFTQGMSLFDRIVVKKAFSAARIQASKRGGPRLNTEENLVAAGKLLDQVILETQQNSLSSRKTEAARRGNMLYRTMMMFKSDAVTTQGRVLDAYGELQYLSALKSQGRSKELKKKIKTTKNKLKRSVGAVVGGALYMLVVSEAFRHLYGKADENEGEEEKNNRLFLEFIGNMVGGMPVISSIMEVFTSGYDLESMEFSAINDILKTAGQAMDLAGEVLQGKATDKDLAKMGEKLIYTAGQAVGLPFRNAKNVIYGFTKLVSPETAYKWDSALYNQSYASDLNDALEKEDYDMAEIIIELAFGEKMGSGLSDKASSELIRLGKLGESVIPSAIGNTVTIDGEERELTGKELKDAREKYSEAVERINVLVETEAFENLTDEQKADAVRKVYSLYKNLAYDEALGTKKDEEAHILSKIVDPDVLCLNELLTVYTADKDENGETISGSKRKKVINAINDMDISDEEKLLLIATQGYVLKDGDVGELSKDDASKMLYDYIGELDISDEERIALYGYCGYEVKEGEPLINDEVKADSESQNESSNEKKNESSGGTRRKSSVTLGDSGALGGNGELGSGGLLGKGSTLSGEKKIVRLGKISRTDINKRIVKIGKLV